MPNIGLLPSGGACDFESLETGLPPNSIFDGGANIIVFDAGSSGLFGEVSVFLSSVTGLLPNNEPLFELVLLPKRDVDYGTPNNGLGVSFSED